MSSATVEMSGGFATTPFNVTAAHAESIRQLRSAEVERWQQLSAERKAEHKPMTHRLKHGITSLFRSH